MTWLKLRDAQVRGIDITVVEHGDLYAVYTPYALLLVAPEELARFAVSILMELGVTPVTEKWAERG